MEVDISRSLSRFNIGRSIASTRLSHYGPGFVNYADKWLNPDAPDGDRAEEVMEQGHVFLINGPDAHEGALCLLKAFVLRRQPVFCIRAPNIAKFWREHEADDWGTMARDARVLGVVPFFEPALMPGPMSKEDQADTEDSLMREMDDNRCMVLVSHGNYMQGWWSETLTKMIAEKAVPLTAIKAAK